MSETTPQRSTTDPDYRNHPIEYTVNRSHIGKLGADDDWRQFHRALRPIQSTLRGLAVDIYSGRSTMPIFKGNRRKSIYFLRAHHIALDFDTEDERSTFAYIAEQPFSIYAGFVYSTPSSRPAAPRSRLVFGLERPIEDADRYELLYRSLQHEYPHADRSAKDAARLFFGSLKCELMPIWSIMPASVSDMLIEMQIERTAEAARQRKENVVTVVLPSSGSYAKYIQSALTAECDAIRSAADGERHNARFRAAAAIGSLVSANWSDLDRHIAFTALVDAAMSNTTSDRDEIERVLLDGFERGMQSPRAEPARTLELEPV